MQHFENETIVDVLQRRARLHPERVAYTFLRDGAQDDADAQDITFGVLDREARALAALLRTRGAEGERVLVLYPSGIPYITALLGCFYAGAVAVPVHAPNLSRPDRFSRRLELIAQDSGAAFALTTGRVAEAAVSLRAAGHPLGRLDWLPTDDVGVSGAEAWTRPNLAGERIAFLQYTSGSTSIPKGVIVTHANVIHNQRVIQTACNHDQDSTFVGWLPMYHDMGLIGNILQPLFIGARSVLMAPTAFLRNPGLWLQAISRYRGYTSGGPNFGYDLCVRRVRPEQRAQLDLSSWTIAFNGAEPISHETLRRFAGAFAPCGFRWEAFYPCYGLAESTLMATGMRPGSTRVLRVSRRALEHDVVEDAPAAAHDGAAHESRESREIVSCGSPVLDQRVLIVNPHTSEPCAPDRVGEIWLGGPSVAAGYWNRVEDTDHAFESTIRGDGRPWLRTGDLGFIRDGELFVTGRLKDVLIIRGRNLYPHDIERTVERTHPDLRPGCGAAFTIEGDDQEQLVIVQEAAPSIDPGALAAIRRAVADEHGVQPYAVVLIRQGTALKTTSGKIQRSATRQAFLEGDLDRIAESVIEPATGITPSGASIREAIADAPPDEREVLVDEYVLACVARASGVDAAAIDMSQPLASLGFDSLRSYELQVRLETDLQVTFDAEAILHATTPGQLVAMVRASVGGGSGQRAQEPARTIYAPSMSQRALWWLDQTSPDSSAYIIARAFMIAGGTVDVAALRLAATQLAMRHDCLRTRFDLIGGELTAIVDAEANVQLDEREIEALNAEQARVMCTAAAYAPFDLARRPPFRMQLLRAPGAAPVLIVTIHHIIADFRSLEILMRDLSNLYAAASRGETAALGAADATYGEFAEWQSEATDSPEGARQLAFWTRQLEGAPPAVDLPCDRMRTARGRARGGSEHIAIDPATLGSLTGIARRAETTVFTVVLSAFTAFLHRLSSQHDLVVGVPVIGRPTRFADVVGYFTNSVALRSSMTGTLTFEEHVQRTNRVVLDALRHQHCPYAAVVEAVDRGPLFNTMFVWQQEVAGSSGWAAAALGLADSKVTLGTHPLVLLPLEAPDVQFDLTVMATERHGGVEAVFKYTRDLFQRGTMRRFARQFREFVEEIAAAPGALLLDMPLTRRGGHVLRGPAPKVSSERLAGLLIHDLIAEQAAREGGAPAVICGDDRLTYRELDDRANQLAQYLRSLGATADSRVAICLERSAATVVSLLAIWKAGAAYVPLDPADPKERLAWLLEDSGARIVITDQAQLDHLPDQLPDVVLLDLDADLVAQMPKEAPPPAAAAVNLAYMIYTSGSTGTPKGVLVEHGALLNLIEGLDARVYAAAAEAAGRRLKVGLNAPLTFDSSIKQFAALVLGHTLYVLPEQVRRNATALLDVVRREALDVLDCTPAQLDVLMELGLSRASHPITLLIGGEAIPPTLWQSVREAPLGDSYNVYGPTECTVDATACAIRSRPRPSLGAPLANTNIAICDDRLDPLPIGVVGELCIGGPSVARGYANQPRLTASTFVPDPGGQPGARRFRTGDVARILTDETIEFLGRRDQQVKIRGRRVELGEIEAAVRRHPDVTDTVAVVRDAADGAQLVCYVVPAAGTSTTAAALRPFLRKWLPEYMLPDAVVEIGWVPLTANGKRDYAALPPPPADRHVHDDVVLPRTPFERWLAQLWADALKLDQVGIDQDFFELGGHSLQATRLVSRVQQVFPTDVPLLTSFFQRPTIEGLVTAVLDGVHGQANREKLASIVDQVEAAASAESGAI